MKDRSIRARSMQGLLVVAAIVAPLAGCDEDCPNGSSPVVERYLSCDELTGNCREHEQIICPCLPGISCLPSTGAASCDATSGAGEWIDQAVSTETAHVIDGAFTGDEWADVEPQQGLFTDVYIEYRAGRLYFLNDWRANDDGIRPECFNFFSFKVGGDRLELRVFGNGDVVVSRRGVEIEHDAEGAYGFGPSPVEPSPHTIYEFSIPLPTGEEINICCFDPVTFASCDVLRKEPMVISLRASDGVQVRRSVPIGSTLRLSRGAACGAGQGICEDGLTCARVGDAQQCEGASPPDAGVGDAGAVDGGFG